MLQTEIELCQCPRCGDEIYSFWVTTEKNGHFVDVEPECTREDNKVVFKLHHCVVTDESFRDM